jgi:hypothetical protein
MARDAADPFSEVDAVVKVDESWKIMYAHPGQRLAGLIADPDRLQHWTVQPDLGVASHTSVSRGNAGKGAGLRGRMAVGAVDSEHAGVVLMAKLHRLLAYVMPIIRIVGSIEGQDARG